VEAGVCDERIEMEMTQDDIDFIVDLHNQLRQRVALGQEDRGASGPQPAALNMPDLVFKHFYSLFIDLTKCINTI
jgi:hypothetical protein